MVKLSSGNILYVLDELFIGLYFEDIKFLLKVLDCLVVWKNIVVVIEYNLDIIKIVDYVIDLGLEGGIGGGYVVVFGIFEEIMKVVISYMGVCFK